MFNTTKTIYNVMLDTSNLLGKTHTVLPNTTLNEKFNVLLSNTENVNPTLRYYCLGLDYESIIQNQTINIDNIRHKPTDGSLFKHIPFIARKTSNDLTESEREDYRLRVLKVLNGEEYVFYFLKLIDDVETNSKLLYITSENNDAQLSLFNTEVDHILTPVMEERDRVNDSLIDYVAYSQHLTITVSDTELNEIYNACNILYGTTDVTLGEIGLVTANSSLHPNNYTEVTNAQIGYFIKINHALENINLQNKFRKLIEIGSVSPMVFRTYREND